MTPIVNDTYELTVNEVQDAAFVEQEGNKMKSNITENPSIYHKQGEKMV